MNFLEAVQAMKEGKKITHPTACCIFHIDRDGYITDQIGNKFEYSFADALLRIDWEVVEEKKTLSDKRFMIASHKALSILGNYKEEDVKGALKEFLDWVTKEPVREKPINWNWDFRAKAKEIFGERLL